MGTNIIKTLGLAGAAFAAWYFLDPKKGPERRDRASKSVRDVYDNLGKELTRIGDEVATAAGDVASRVGTVAGDVASRVGSMTGSVVEDAGSAAEGARHAVNVD